MQYYRDRCRQRARTGGGPASIRLDARQTHCEVEHGATVEDYRRRVREWHSEAHPDCAWTPTTTAAR